jgi:hypothetical protein
MGVHRGMKLIIDAQGGKKQRKDKEFSIFIDFEIW